ncbi:glutathione S-transferase family protein [Paraburkholderia antibiotica]|uniref:Glutathione S-transferase domain-containing protein n=1 Tax=Paraburkholderia antibiotica TaxID=2728839 RepID=A0A7Y0A2Z4_9BURK|nr:glutathione S-transferase domain-containing protein [Paraburkholderia antibiotica]NML35473.1 glutathione S-transferase domain-containing protein [Paraburkholderia antibiotica]
MYLEDPLVRAQHRAWMEYGSTVLSRTGGFYSAADAGAFDVRREELAQLYARVEAFLSARDHQGPYFAGETFSLVDAVFAPIFRYFDVLDEVAEFGVFSHTPNVRALVQIGLPDRLKWRSNQSGGR